MAHFIPCKKNDDVCFAKTSFVYYFLLILFFGFVYVNDDFSRTFYTFAFGSFFAFYPWSVIDLPSWFLC